jgi:hypothetical protein
MIITRDQFISYLKNHYPLNYLDYEVIFNDVSFDILDELDAYSQEKLPQNILTSIKDIMEKLENGEFYKYVERIKSTSKEMYEFIGMNELDLKDKIPSLFCY